MTRAQLEHVLRAAGAIADIDQLVVIGSQSILGQHPGAPAELLVSAEADLVSLRDPKDAELIDGSIGETSPFHQTFGYYAHGVGAETATLPKDWQSRLIPVAVKGVAGPDVIGLCLDTTDLAVSKLVAGREKDISFVAALLRHGLVDSLAVVERVALLVSEDDRKRCINRITRILSK